METNLDISTDLGDKGRDMMLHEAAHAGLVDGLEEGGDGQRGEESVGVIYKVLEAQVAGRHKEILNKILSDFGAGLCLNVK